MLSLKQLKKRLSIKSMLLQQVFLRTMPFLKQLQTRLPIRSKTVQVFLGTKLTKKKRILATMLPRKKSILRTMLTGRKRILMVMMRRLSVLKIKLKIEKKKSASTLRLSTKSLL